MWLETKKDLLESKSLNFVSQNRWLFYVDFYKIKLKNEMWIYGERVSNREGTLGISSNNKRFLYQTTSGTVWVRKTLGTHGGWYLGLYDGISLGNRSSYW